MRLIAACCPPVVDRVTDDATHHDLRHRASVVLAPVDDDGDHGLFLLQPGQGLAGGGGVTQCSSNGVICQTVNSAARAGDCGANVMLGSLRKGGTLLEVERRRNVWLRARHTAWRDKGRGRTETSYFPTTISLGEISWLAINLPNNAAAAAACMCGGFRSPACISERLHRDRHPIQWQDQHNDGGATRVLFLIY